MYAFNITGYSKLSFMFPVLFVLQDYPLGTLRPIYRTGVKLPSRCPILYICSTNISTEYFKHAV